MLLDQHEIIARRMASRIKELRRSAAEVSRASGYGPDFIRDFLKGRKRSMNAEAMSDIARELKVTPAWLQGDDAAMPEPPPAPVESAAGRTLPVYGTAAGSLAGTVHILPDVIEWVPCPPGLAKLRDVYALYVMGYSMVPRFRQGEVIFVAPHRPPRPGDDVVIQVHGENDDETESWVKELVSDDGERVVARQYNPPAEIEFAREKVIEIHRILPINEIIGI